VSEDLWSERDTTPGRVEAALRELFVERHRTSSGHVPARVLNMVVVVDDDFHGEIENRLERVGRFHPSRLIICRVRPGHETLDAWASITGADDALEPGRISVVHERISLLMGPQHLRALHTVVDPLVVSDIATMVWAPHGHDAAVEDLRRLAQVVLLDSLDDPSVGAALARAADLRDDAHVVDLAWLRSTPWRERVAAAFDAPAHRPSLAAISGVEVRHRHDSAAAAILFCGWLASRLGWRAEELLPRDGGFTGRARARRTDVGLRCVAEDVGVPGLGGVTVECAGGEAVSLDRAPGGLCEVRRERDGAERRFRVFGASRGEGGILGEGVRQALLRDPTYAPALDAARELVAA
jgi:glucose-6-phosphate dehydrogenase assembly protein OpcA